MLPDRVSNPGPLTYESGALPIALRGPAHKQRNEVKMYNSKVWLKKYKVCISLFLSLSLSLSLKCASISQVSQTAITFLSIYFTHWL